MSDQVASGKPRARATGPLTVMGLTLRGVEPSTVVNGQFKPLPRVLRAAKGATAAPLPPPPPALPEGQAFLATTAAFGKKAVGVKAAVLDDGRKFATFDVQEKGFDFRQLFKDFECDGVDLFVFDDAKVHVEQRPAGAGTQDVVRFSGTLRMDSGPLATIRDLLGLKEGLYISGEIDLGGQVLSGKIDPRFVSLKSAANFHVPFGDGVTLTSAALQLSIGRKMDNVKMKTGWQMGVCLMGTLELTRLGTQDPVVMHCVVSYGNGTLHVNAACDAARGLFGIPDLVLDALKASFDVGKQNDLELAAQFSPNVRSFDFGGRLSAQGAGLYATAENFTLDDLVDLYASVSSKELALPDYDVKFEKVMIGLATADCAVGSVSLARGLTLGCTVTVHGHTCSANALISADGVLFTGELGELDIGSVRLADAKMHLEIHTASSGKPTEFSIFGSATIERVAVQCKVCYEKVDGAWNCVLYAGLAAKAFSLGTVFPPATGTFVDTLTFSRLAFVYSSKDGKTKDPDFAFPVQKGLQLIGVLEEVPALKSLTGSRQAGLIFAAHFGAKPEIGIEIPDTRLRLGSSVTCGALKIKIVLAPTPALCLMFGMKVRMPKQDEPLHFDVMLSVDALRADASVTEDRWWDRPFGVEGLRIGPKLALELGIIYEQFVATGLPSEFGFAGGLALGEVEAQMAVKISEDPTHEILMGELSRLTPKDLVAFAGSVTGLRLPAEAVPDFIEIQDLELYCAPAGGSIGTITFEPGMSFSGQLVLFGKTASLYTRFSDAGVVAKGHLDALELGPLKIHGATGRDAELDLELTSDKQSVLLDGAFELLGSSVAVHADISKTGVRFDFDETFLGLLTFAVHGESSGTLSNPSSLDFLLSAEFDNDLTEYLATTVAQKLHEAIAVVEADIDEAKRKVDAAEKAYKAEFEPKKKALDEAQRAADAYLRKCQKTLEDEKQKYTAELENAKKDVERTKKAFDGTLKSAEAVLAKAQTSYDHAVKAAERTLAKAQAEYESALRLAQKGVNDARRRYDGAMNSAIAGLDSAERHVGSLQQRIDNAVRHLKRLKWYEYSYKGPYYSGMIAGLEVAMRTAQGALEVAKAFLKGVKYGAEYTALEAAKKALQGVQTVGEYAVFESAKAALEGVRYGGEYGVLEAAKRTLAGVRTGTEYAVWQAALKTLSAVETTGRAALTAAETCVWDVERSAAYVALETAKLALEAVEQGTAFAVFESAKVALEAAKQGSEAMLELAAFVAEHAGDIIAIERIALSSRLSELKAGKPFSAEMRLALFGHAQTWKLEFDVRNVASFVEGVFMKALGEAKRVALPGA